MASTEKHSLASMEEGGLTVRVTRPFRSRFSGITAGPAPYALLACLLLFPVLAWYQMSPAHAGSLGLHEGQTSRSTTEGLQWSRCSEEHGSGSERHEEFLSRLNGRRISFVGDSIIRFQYLELAYYLVHGECINSLDPGDVNDVTQGHNESTVFSDDDFVELNRFLKASSETLNVREDHFFASEIMMGSRLDVHQSWTDEQRVFTYMDNWGRRIELTYSQYFDEGIGRLKQTIAAVDNLQPTDVVLNFGAVFQDFPRNTDCGTIWSDGSVSKSLCPFMKGVCKHFIKKHPYNLYWQSTTPRIQGGNVNTLDFSMSLGHSLNPISACQLPKGKFLDTYSMIEKLASSERQQVELYTGENALVPDAYHVFNWNLVQRFPFVKSNLAPVNSKWTPGGSVVSNVRR